MREVYKNKFQQDLDKQCDLSEMALKNYDLDNETQTWSDFSYARYHHRTVNIVKQYEHNNNEVPFDIYPVGRSLWHSEQFEEDFSDKIRQYIEECNSFQVNGQ